MYIQTEMAKKQARIDDCEWNKATAHSAKHREKATRHTRLSFKQKENEQNRNHIVVVVVVFILGSFSIYFFHSFFFPLLGVLSICFFFSLLFVNSFSLLRLFCERFFFAVSQTCLFMNITFFHDLFRLAHFIRLFIIKYYIHAIWVMIVVALKMYFTSSIFDVWVL